MDLNQMQLERNAWVEKNFPGDDMPNSLLGAIEELGELAHHYLKAQQGIRGDVEFHKAEMADAVADCVIFLAGVATYLGVDYGDLVRDTWFKVKHRDWIANPKDGVSG